LEAVVDDVYVSRVLVVGYNMKSVDFVKKRLLDDM
jgi:hypothetical protein